MKIDEVPIIACEKCDYFTEVPVPSDALEGYCDHPDCFSVSEGRNPVTGKYRQERVKNYSDLNRDCSCSRFKGETMNRRERNHIAAGPSAPVLEGEVAEEFLETIEKNKTRRVPKSSFDRAQRAYKNFTKPDNGNYECKRSS